MIIACIGFFFRPSKK